MRIQRDLGQPIFRRRQSRGGCMPLVILMGVCLGVLAVSWDWLGQWLNINIPRSQPNLHSAETAFEKGDLAETIAASQQILESEPHNAYALTLLARALIYRSYTDYNLASDRESALELTTTAYQRQPRNIDIQAIHAYALQANGLSEEATRLALRVIEADSANLPARITLSLAYGSQGIFEAALREANRAVELASFQTDWQVDAHRVLAIAYSDLGRYDKAVETVTQALTYNHRLIPLHFEKALYALQIGNSDTATVAYFQILAFDEANVKARFRLCELSSTMREREAAIRYCGEVTERAPQWSDGWYQLGREYFLQGSFESAQDAFHRCASLQVMQDVPIPERRFECWYLQGQAAEIVGDCENLVTIYNEFRAMATDPRVRQTWTYPPDGPICQPS